MNRTERRRLQRLEARVPGPSAPPIVIVSREAESGLPFMAACGPDEIFPNPGESFEDFEARAVEHFTPNAETAVILDE